MSTRRGARGRAHGKETMPAAHDVALIERRIESDPTGRSKADAQLRESGASVWAIIGYLRLLGLG